MGAYHSKASESTPKIKHPIQERQGEASNQNLMTQGQGETEGGHQKPETRENLLVYQYPNSSSTMKQLALKSPERSISPARQSQEQFEKRLLQQGLEGLAMGDNNNNNTKTYAIVTTFEFPIEDIRVRIP